MKKSNINNKNLLTNYIKLITKMIGKSIFLDFADVEKEIMNDNERFVSIFE